MISKIFYVYLIIIKLSYGENIFEKLYNSNDCCRVTASATNSRTVCRGLVWNHDWIITQASCIFHFPLTAIIVKSGRALNSSHDVTASAKIATDEQLSRVVLSCHSHPALDLALLRLNSPYNSTISIFNGNISSDIINKLDDWMKGIVLAENMKKIKSAQYITYEMYTTSTKMFLLTVVLPSASFIVFFLFILFFTGKNKSSSKIPYRHLIRGKKETTYYA